MRPVLFLWRGRPVWSYVALLYVGLVVGLVVGNVEANLRGLDGTRVYLATVLLLIPALAGARLVYVAGHWGQFRDRPRAIWQHSVGGQAMYGGLLTVPLSLPLLAGLDLPFWGFWDVATFTMLTGMVFTRVGCLLNGCCAGKPTDRIPMQLVEAGMGLVVLTGVTAIPVGAPAGTVFLAAVAGYASGRLLFEGKRKEVHRVAGFGSQRLASVSLAVTAIALLSLSLWRF